jgi:hypothetical protein
VYLRRTRCLRMCATRLAKEFPEMALLVGCKRLRTVAAPVPVLEKTLPRLVGMSPSRSFFTSRFVFGAPSGVVQRDSRGSLRSLGLGIVGHVVGTEASVKFYRCQFRMRRSTQRELGFHHAFSQRLANTLTRQPARSAPRLRRVCRIARAEGSATSPPASGLRPFSGADVFEAT